VSYSKRHVTWQVTKKGILDKDAGLEQRTEGVQARDAETQSRVEIAGLLNNIGLHEPVESAIWKEGKLCKERELCNKKHERKALGKDLF
jgi:hypothetical protein